MGPDCRPDFAALEQADAVIQSASTRCDTLLASLDQRRSRAHTVIALPAAAAGVDAGVDGERLQATVTGATRRVVVPLTPGVLVAATPIDGLVPAEALTPSVDGPLVGLDDFIGATYLAICDDAMRGFVDVTLPRTGETAALPAAIAKWSPEVRVLQLRAPLGVAARSVTELGFTPTNATLAETIACELGWPS